MFQVATSVFSAFAVLTPALAVQAVPVTPSLYADLERDFASFKHHVLISGYEFSADWSTWERHPAGDEMVLLLSGRVTLTLEAQSGETLVELADPGSYAIVPRGIWHTARVPVPSRMLFITPGEGTEIRAT